MDLLPYLVRFHEQLLDAADAGGDDARAVAQRLTGPLESSARLMLLDALSRATDEISHELAPGSVDLRLRGLDPEFVVTLTAEAPLTAAEPPVTSERDHEAAGTSRMTLRLPEHLKTRVETAASQEGASVNTWLVRAVSTALDTGSGRRGPRSMPGEQTFRGWTRS